MANFLALLIAWIAWITVELLSAPEGYEDRNGFHYGTGHYWD
jgi:hypothetical protein